MKTRLILSVILALSSVLCALSQTPQGFNYQAIARNASGDAITNQSLPVRLTIQSDSLSGTIWQEVHSSVTTNSFGLFNVIVGKGTRQASSAVPTFSDIDWKVTPKFIKTEVYYNSEWKNMGSSRLWSVPYSMAAEELTGSVKKLTVAGETTSMEEPLFEVKNRNGQTVFAVYNEGVRVYVDDGTSKGVKGGFAIGSFGTDKGTTDPLFVVNADSIRAYIKQVPAKGVKGGFAIGSFDPSKAYYYEEYLQVTRDSTRVYVKEPAKGVKGGFAIGGFDASKASPYPFTSLTSDNYFIGHQAGSSLTTGLYNAIMGYESGRNITSGLSNSFLGYQSGFSNTTGTGNLFLGYQTGYSNNTGSYNSFVGYQAGFNNTVGEKNTFIGSYSGISNYYGTNNTFTGYNAGFSNYNGHANNFFGTSSGYSNSSGSNNTFVGPESGYYNTTGSYNTFLGYRAGYNNTANNNVFIGNECGYSNTTGSLNVFIGYAAGHENTTGDGNIFLGNGAGHYNTVGQSNVFMGMRSGFNNQTGEQNVYIGYMSGMNGTSPYSNVCIGYQSGKGLSTAYNNVFVGSNTGLNTTWGESNVFIGTSAGEANVTGGYNVHIGTGAGQKATASDNIFIGYGSGFSTTTGGSNVYLGMQAGFQNVTGQNNVFLGKYAGYYETGSDKLYIDNSLTTTPLIYGDFSTDNLTINGNLTAAGTWFKINGNPGSAATPAYYCYQGAAGSSSKSYAFSVNDALWVTGPSFMDSKLDIDVSTAPALSVLGDEALWYNGTYFSWGYGGTYNYFADKVTIGNAANPAYTLYVQGSAYATGTWTGSDARWKKDLVPIVNTLEKINEIQSYTYKWKSDEYPGMNFDNERQIGLMAQDVEKVFPELVRTDDNGYKAVSYDKLSVVLLEAIKEQQHQIEAEKAKNKELENELSSLKERLSAIEAMMGNK